jgi:2-oxoglutarate ferredoxin oxidoreductase subunit gamma
VAVQRLVFSGSGGQGVITAAILLGEAAAIHEGLRAVQTQSYGPEARGGATRADVVISDVPIHYPKVIHPHLLVTLTQEAYNKYAKIIRPGGILLSDPKFVDVGRKVDAIQMEIPMYDAVMETIGKPVVFNVCMLGVLTGIFDLVKPGSIMKALEKKIAPEFLELNQRALELGRKLFEDRDK